MITGIFVTGYGYLTELIRFIFFASMLINNIIATIYETDTSYMYKLLALHVILFSTLISIAYILAIIIYSHRYKRAL